MVVHSLPREPDFLIPVTTEKIKEGYLDLPASFKIAKKVYGFELKKQFRLQTKILVEMETLYKEVEDTIDDVLYWDEKKNLIYVEAIAVFKDVAEFIRFRKDLPTAFSLTEFECPICNCKQWKPEEIDVKTVKDEKGKTWKCFSIIFACKRCLEEGRLTKRAVKIQGLKYALIKAGRGLKDFLDRIKKIEVRGDLKNEAGNALVEVGEKVLELKHCPLL